MFKEAVQIKATCTIIGFGFILVLLIVVVVVVFILMKGNAFIYGFVMIISSPRGRLLHAVALWACFWDKILNFLSSSPTATITPSRLRVCLLLHLPPIRPLLSPFSAHTGGERRLESLSLSLFVFTWPRTASFALILFLFSLPGWVLLRLQMDFNPKKKPLLKPLMSSANMWSLQRARRTRLVWSPLVVFFDKTLYYFRGLCLKNFFYKEYQRKADILCIYFNGQTRLQLLFIHFKC